MEGVPNSVYSQPDLDAWFDAIGTKLPAWIGRLRDVRELGRIANHGQPRYNILGDPQPTHYDWDTGHTPIAMAWLSGNPAFERMVQDNLASYARNGGDGPDSATAELRRLVAELRKLPRAG